MKNYITKCSLFICLCIFLLAATSPFNQPRYMPSTYDKLGLGGKLVIPYGISLDKDEKEYIGINHLYKIAIAASYSLIIFKTSYLSLEADISYSPTDIINKKLGLRLEEQHIRLCPALAFTIIGNKLPASRLVIGGTGKDFYVLYTIWLGYEWDIIPSSQLTQNDITDDQWTSTHVTGNLAMGNCLEFFRGIYLDVNVTIPITEIIRYKKSNYYRTLKNKQQLELETFLLKSRILTASLFDVGIGVNILSVLYPPKQPKSSESYYY